MISRATPRDRLRGCTRLLATVIVAVSSSSCWTGAAPARFAPHWKLVWSDEFNGPARHGPDKTKWVFDTGGEPQWGNQEWEYYTKRLRNVSLDGHSHLVITARREQLPGMKPCQYGPCNITSGRITTRGRFSITYGRFEARMKVPAGQGLWPAFWMMGTDQKSHPWPANGEIDVMEIIGRGPRTVYGTAHGPGFADAGIGGRLRLPPGHYFSQHFHTFAVVWGPRRIDWLVDGRRYFTLQKSRLRTGQKWVFDHSFYLLLNLAVGGDWPGPPNASTKFPAPLAIDWARVYQKPG